MFGVFRYAPKGTFLDLRKIEEHLRFMTTSNNSESTPNKSESTPKSPTSEAYNHESTGSTDSNGSEAEDTTADDPA